MGYRLNRLDEPVFMAVPKPMLTEFRIHYRLESCGPFFFETETLSFRNAIKMAGHAVNIAFVCNNVYHY